MWVQGGFQPDTFWHQTPRHFQLAMQGVRKRLENEQLARSLQSYETGAFSGLAHHGKLKAFKHYDRRPKAQTPREMVTAIQSLGAKSNMKIRRITREA